MTDVAALVAHDLRLARRHGGDALSALLFFVVAASAFPLAVGPGPALLARMGPGIVWVCALLAAVLPLDRLFGADYDDGMLDWLLASSGLSATGVAAARVVSHWLTTGAPLLIVAAPLATVLHVPPHALPALLLGLAMGTAVLSLLGVAAAAVVLGARRGGVLLPVLVLPLAVPALIFGAAAADAAGAGLSPRPNLLLLAAYLCLCVPLAPVAAGAALRAAVD